MTERRPHWSDDLIDAVRDAVDVEFDDIWKLSEDSIRAVIAAVEDWQDNHALMHKVRLLWTQQAVIQSVRDVYEDYFHDRSDLDAIESLEAIRRALDGPQ